MFKVGATYQHVKMPTTAMKVLAIDETMAEYLVYAEWYAITTHSPPRNLNILQKFSIPKDQKNKWKKILTF